MDTPVVDLEKEVNDNEQQVIIDDFIKEAEKAANIVANSVENGEVSDVSRKLRTYSVLDTEKESYVFDFLPIGRWFFAIIMSFIFIVAFVYIVLISCGTLVYSDEYRAYGAFGTAMSLLIIVINLCIIKKASSEIQFTKRYASYSNVLKYHNMELIEDLASMIDVKKNIVEKDLNKAIINKLIPQGHFGRGNTIFIVSDVAFQDYSDHRAAYDRYYRKKLEERKRLNKRTKETEQLLEQGQGYIDKIHDSNDLIKDKDISVKLLRMENVVSAIFHEVDINPEQANKLGLFMNYYLPTTEKLLEKYIEIDEKKIKGKSLKKAQQEITDALDSINNAFEGLLERFYQEQEIDVAGDISALEIIMQQEGLQSYDE